MRNEVLFLIRFYSWCDMASEIEWEGDVSMFFSQSSKLENNDILTQIDTSNIQMSFWALVPACLSSLKVGESLVLPVSSSLW